MAVVWDDSVSGTGAGSWRKQENRDVEKGACEQQEYAVL